MPHLLPAAASAIAAAAPAAAAGAAKATIMTTLKSVAFNALTNLAISAALSVFSPTVGASARTVEFVIDPDGPIPFAAGYVGVPGAMAHKDTFGPDLMYYGIPVILSGAGPITAIQSVKADDYPMAFDANGGATTEPYRQEFFFRSVLGHQPAPAALTTPNGFKNNAKLPGWTAAHKLSGKAAFLMVMAENSKGSAFPNGEVKPLVEVLGLKGWDPTQDSTYPGGNGPCRLHDASTWVTLTCPILWGLKWALGLWEGPTLKGAPAHDSTTDHQVGGIGARLSGVDVPAFVAASNIAKANAWTVSAYPNTDDDKHQVLETFLQAGGAIYSQRAGKISCISRAAPRASLVTISAADTAGPLEIDTAASRIDRINTLRPRFWSPAHRWQMTAMDGEVTAQSYREEDGGRTRSRGVDFPFVSNAKQTGQLAALQIANTREGIAGVIPLKPHLQRIRPGDAFTITEAGFVLNGLKCLCLNTDYDPATGVVRVSFVSETDAKYPFALGQNPTPPTPQVLTPVDPRFVSPPGAGDWTITPRPPAPGGGQMPGFDLGGVVSNDTATAIIVETGPTATGPWAQAYQGPPTVTNIPIDGLQSGATYYVAIQYQRNQNYSERYVYGPYTAPVLDPGPNAPSLTQLRGDIELAFGDVREDVAVLVGQTRADLEAADDALDAAIGSVGDRADVLESQTQALEENKASVGSLNAQVVRIDNAVAVNAAQALALVDLENGKVALSEYNTLKGEVTAARDGAPSLLGQIQNLKSVDLGLQENKASVTSVNALTARTATAEGNILDLFNAQATEAGARVQADNILTARQRSRSNLLVNGSGELGTQGVTALHIESGTTLFINPTTNSWGPIIEFGPVGPGTYLIRWPSVAAEVGATYTIAGDAAVGNLTSGDRSYYDVAFLDDAGNTVPGGDGGESPVAGSHGFSETRRDSYAVASLAPAGTKRVQARFVVEASGSSPTYLAVRQVKLERGALPATAYTNDQAAKELSATVAMQSLAIVDLENQQALASWNVVAAATGGKPARIGLTSSSLGSFIALDAPFIFWGDNTVFDDATDTLQTTIGGYRRVLAFGAPFGASGNLLEWWGLDSIALSAMTTANGLNGRMTTAPGVFDNVFSSQASALRSSVAVNSAAGTTNDTNWTTWGTATYSNLPLGGLFKLFAEARPNSGMTIGGPLGSTFDGEYRVVQSGTTIAAGPVTAYVGGGDADVSVDMPATPVAPAATGVTSLVLQVRRASGSSYIDGAGATVTFYAEWTKAG